MKTFTFFLILLFLLICHINANFMLIYRIIIALTTLATIGIFIFLLYYLSAVMGLKMRKCSKSIISIETTSLGIAADLSR